MTVSEHTITTAHNLVLDQLIDAKLENEILRHRALSAEHRLTQVRRYVNDHQVLQRTLILDLMEF